MDMMYIIAICKTHKPINIKLLKNVYNFNFSWLYVSGQPSDYA